MKKLFIILIVSACTLFSCISDTQASNKIKLYLFHGEGCGHCAEAIPYLETIQKDYSNLEVVSYEVFLDTENETLWNKVKEKLESDSKGVPFMVIGERYLTGFSEYRKEDIKASLAYYQEHMDEYKDVVEITKKEMIMGEDVTPKESEVIKPIAVNGRKKVLYRNLFLASGLLIIFGGIYIYIVRKEKRA